MLQRQWASTHRLAGRIAGCSTSARTSTVPDTTSLLPCVQNFYPRHRRARSCAVVRLHSLASNLLRSRCAVATEGCEVSWLSPTYRCARDDASAGDCIHTAANGDAAYGGHGTCRLRHGRPRWHLARAAGRYRAPLPNRRNPSSFGATEHLPRISRTPAPAFTGFARASASRCRRRWLYGKRRRRD